MVQSRMSASRYILGSLAASGMKAIGCCIERVRQDTKAILKIGMSALNSLLSNKGIIMCIPKINVAMSGAVKICITSIWLVTVSARLVLSQNIPDSRG